MYQTYFNATPGPVIVDDDGRQIDGSSWGPALSTSQHVRDALAAGRLVKVARPDGDDLDPDARSAFDATERLEDARKASPEALAEAAETEKAPRTKAAARAAQEGK